MLENAVEAVLVSEVKKRHGVAVKLVPNPAGMPDRLVLLPGHRPYLVELKQVHGSLSAVQRLWKSRLDGMGHTVIVLKGTGDAVREWLKSLG